MFFLAVQWVLESISKNCLGLSWDFPGKKLQNFQTSNIFVVIDYGFGVKKAKYFHIFECQVVC
jgi:hypothetical protein